MAQDGSLVESLPDRPLNDTERDALERHESIQLIMPQTTKFGSEHGMVIDIVMLTSHDWVTAVTYEAGHG